MAYYTESSLAYGDTVRMILALFILLLIPTILTSAPPDPVLDQLRSIRLPHIFSPTEGDMMMNQLDILALGIQLFLAEERERTQEMQQQVYSMIWPLLKCLFKKDWDIPSTMQPGGMGEMQQPGMNQPQSNMAMGQPGMNQQQPMQQQPQQPFGPQFQQQQQQQPPNAMNFPFPPPGRYTGQQNPAQQF